MVTNLFKPDIVLYPDLSYTINGILFSTHNELGQYAREKQYGDVIAELLKKTDTI